MNLRTDLEDLLHKHFVARPVVIEELHQAVHDFLRLAALLTTYEVSIAEALDAEQHVMHYVMGFVTDVAYFEELVHEQFASGTAKAVDFADFISRKAH